MAILFDGIWTSPQVSGAPRLQFDIPELPREATSIAVPMMSPFSVYSIPTSGATTDFVLYETTVSWAILGDSGFSDAGGGVWSFTREWVRKPPSFNDFSTFAANYPGIRGSRDPQLLVQTSKREIDFFLIMPTGGDHTSPDLIPITQESRVTYLTSSVQAPILGNVYLATGFFGFQNTSPSPASYMALVATDTGSNSSYSLQSDPSEIAQVRGILWRRINRKLKAR